MLFAVAGGSDLTMWEIQEAAKVITNAVDPDAKIIFGAIQDERLKKGDIKITVIASGFPDNIVGKSATLFGPFPRKNVSPEASTQNVQKNAENEHDISGDSESEWDSVPAFMRRMKR